MFSYVWDLSDISLDRKTESHVLWWTIFQLPKTMQMVVRKKADFHVIGVWIVIGRNVWCGNSYKGA
jgi:hypothetical protein